MAMKYTYSIKYNFIKNTQMLYSDEKLYEFIKRFTMSDFITSLYDFITSISFQGGYSIEDCATDGDKKLFTKIQCVLQSNPG